MVRIILVWHRGRWQPKVDGRGQTELYKQNQPKSTRAAAFNVRSAKLPFKY